MYKVPDLLDRYHYEVKNKGKNSIKLQENRQVDTTVTSKSITRAKNFK